MSFVDPFRLLTPQSPSFVIYVLFAYLFGYGVQEVYPRWVVPRSPDSFRPVVVGRVRPPVVTDPSVRGCGLGDEGSLSRLQVGLGSCFPSRPQPRPWDVFSSTLGRRVPGYDTCRGDRWSPPEDCGRYGES